MLSPVFFPLYGQHQYTCSISKQIHAAKSRAKNFCKNYIIEFQTEIYILDPFLYAQAYNSENIISSFNSHSNVNRESQQFCHRRRTDVLHLNWAASDD